VTEQQHRLGGFRGAGEGDDQSPVEGQLVVAERRDLAVGKARRLEPRRDLVGKRGVATEVSVSTSSRTRSRNASWSGRAAGSAAWAAAATHASIAAIVIFGFIFGSPSKFAKG
jgi:hypothetical protein